MRIRNSKPPFPLPSLPSIVSRPNRYRSRDHSTQFDDRFLVEETNRRIGWSCYPLRIPLCQNVGEGSSSEFQHSVVKGIGTMSCENEKKGEDDNMQEKSSQVFGGQLGGEANEGSGSSVSTYNLEDGKASSMAVTVATIPPLSSFQPGLNSELLVITDLVGGIEGKELPLKKIKPTYECDTDVVEVEDTMLKEELDKTQIHELEDTGEERPKTSFCVMNCENFNPPDNNGFDGDETHKEVALEETVAAQLVENPLGQERDASNEFGDANRFIEFMGHQAPKRGRPKRVIDHAANGNNGCTEVEKQKRGRPPKRVKYGKRGQPRKANNPSQNAHNENQEEQKSNLPRSRGRPRKYNYNQ